MGTEKGAYLWWDFGEQTEHESSEQLLTELLDGVRAACKTEAVD